MLFGLVLAFANVSTFAQRQVGNPTTVPPFDQQPDRKGVNPCCPPIWGESFNRFFRVHQLPGKNITDTYGLEFMPDAGLDAQMKAYAPYAGLYAPAGWVANSVLLVAEMKKLTLANTSTPTAAAFNASGNVPVYVDTSGSLLKHALRGWWTVPASGIWNGPHADYGAHVWEKMYMDGVHSQSPQHMQPNVWYMIKLTLQLASKRPQDPNSWRQDDINCSIGKPRYVAVMVRSVAAKAGPGATAAQAAQIIEVQQ